jgi:hypothetical protein
MYTRRTNKLSGMNMEVAVTSEALRRAFFDGTNVIVGQPLGHAGEADSMVEQLARKGEAARIIDV